MKTITAVNSKTLKTYYNNPNGNLYWHNPDTDCWELVDSFSEEDCLEALSNKVQFAFVSGPAVSCFRIN